MLKRISALALLMAFLLCGCGKKDTASDKQQSSAKTEAVATESTLLATESVAVAVDDSRDPQNTENPNGTGAEVKADSLTVKTGKANGIDVSKWQGKINWSSVKSAGIDFAIIRIGYRAEDGALYKDPNADYNIQQADKAGILVGVYFFSTAINRSEALKEAEWTAQAIKSYPISYPVVYDCEGYLSSGSRMYSLTAAQRTDNALAFLSEIQKQGYEGMFYAAKGELESNAHWEVARISASFKIWVAQYPAVTYPAKSNPDYTGKYDMWQYTNMGKVKGISGNTDMAVSYFTKSKAAPKSTEAVKTAEAPTVKDPVYTAVNETVTAKELVNLRTAAGTGAEIAGTLKNGQTAVRTGLGANGWSRLTYNGKTVYAITSYLTTDLNSKPVTSVAPPSDGFTATEEKVTAKDVVNLRESPTTSSASKGQLKNGETAVRIGINSASGWSKLSYNGQTVYAVTSFLTADLSYKKPQETSSVTAPVQSDGFEAVNQQVTAKDTTNLRSKPTTEGSEIIYTLPNGEYVTRTGINSVSGWSRLSYNGQTVYAVTSYLTVQVDTDEE